MNVQEVIEKGTHMKDRYKLLIVVGIFVAAYFIPFGDERVKKAILEAFYMIQDYAQKHVLLCLVPAFFIAGAITVFVSQASVMKYLGLWRISFLLIRSLLFREPFWPCAPAQCFRYLLASTGWGQD